MKTDGSPDCPADETELEQCNAYIIGQIQAMGKPSAYGLPSPGPAITISYQSGSGEHEIARRLAAILQSSEVDQAVPWTVFDRQLVEKMLAEHHLPDSLARLMPEERRSYIRDVVEELLGLRPPSWVLVPEVTETILHLVNAGHVILVGRGGAFITARMPNVFHVRLIGSLPKRIARVQELNHVTPEEAGKFVAGSDRGRGRYAKAHFHVRVDDDLLYHLAVNTDCVPPPEAAELIADGARRRFQIGTGGKK
ncbi:MAG: cytidylate kinase-like family protein [Opitutaceae bacterium]|jgi:cytidylate kinase